MRQIFLRWNLFSKVSFLRKSLNNIYISIYIILFLPISTYSSKSNPFSSQKQEENKREWPCKNLIYKTLEHLWQPQQE